VASLPAPASLVSVYVDLRAYSSETLLHQRVFESEKATIPLVVVVAVRERSAQPRLPDSRHMGLLIHCQGIATGGLRRRRVSARHSTHVAVVRKPRRGKPRGYSVYYLVKG
jgi:hypothetical protein